LPAFRGLDPCPPGAPHQPRGTPKGGGRGHTNASGTGDRFNRGRRTKGWNGPGGGGGGGALAGGEIGGAPLKLGFFGGTPLGFSGDLIPARFGFFSNFFLPNEGGVRAPPFPAPGGGGATPKGPPQSGGHGRTSRGAGFFFSHRFLFSSPPPDAFWLFGGRRFGPPHPGVPRGPEGGTEYADFFPAPIPCRGGLTWKDHGGGPPMTPPEKGGLSRGGKTSTRGEKGGVFRPAPPPRGGILLNGPASPARGKGARAFPVPGFSFFFGRGPGGGGGGGGGCRFCWNIL